MSRMYIINQLLGIRLDKRHIINRKENAANAVKTANVNGAGASGLRTEPLSKSFRGEHPLRMIFRL